MRELIVALTVALGALLWPGAAHASDDYGVISVDLRVKEGDVPTHLCVVSEASPRAREKLSDLLEAPEAKSKNKRAQSWRVKPKVWQGDDASTRNRQCADGQSPDADCRPRLTLTEGLARRMEDLYVACSEDSLTAGGSITDPRPLFIYLEYLEGSPPQVESVRLTGGVATIGVLRRNFDRVIVSARSLGGHYLPDERSERGTSEGSGGNNGNKAPKQKNVELTLTPRCRLVEITLPGTAVSADDRNRLSVRVHGIPINVDRCVQNLAGRDVIQVRMPPAPLNVGSVDVNLKAQDGRAAASFGGSFTGAWAKAPFALQFKQVTFGWRRPKCIFPENVCPSATLDTGTECSSETTKYGCEYTCPGEFVDQADVDLTFPLEVTFDKVDPGQRWTDKLAKNGQILASYVPADEIYLRLAIPGWHSKIRVPDNRIHSIELFGEDGQPRRHSIEILDDAPLKVPGATCETLQWRAVGDRRYRVGAATIQNGRLDPGKNPNRRAHVVSFNVTLALGGGPAWSEESGSPTPLFFSGLGMFAVQIRARKPGWQRIGWEFRVGGTLGNWGLEQATELQRIGWARFLFEPGLVAALHDRVATGVGYGLGFSLPFRDDRNLVDDTPRFIHSPSLDFRFKVARWLQFMLQFRGVLNEKAFVDEPDGVQEGVARSLLTLGGVVASF